MKLKLILLCLFSLSGVILMMSDSLLIGITIEIKQDGSGDFTEIQAGINAAANSDSILVFPGIYYENINYNGKSINISSLFVTTNDEQYIESTVINGNQAGSCVRVISGEDSTTTICGFTLTNGSGSSYDANDYNFGGGILLWNSNLKVINCDIKENISQTGGGIYCRWSNLSLSGVNIFKNNSYFGGGLAIYQEGQITFNPENLCNIFLNSAGSGCDILKAWSSPALEVYVDTFTVANPGEYHIRSTTTMGIPLNDVTLNMQNAKVELVNADLYVSSEGDDNNSGLSESEPLKTISYAITKVKSDSLHPNTIHIADGTYSRSLNNQNFPLNMKGYVSLIGESPENTILDAENFSNHISDIYSNLDYNIENFKFINGNGEVFLNNVGISLHSRDQQNGIEHESEFVKIKNIIFPDNTAYRGALIFASYMDVTLDNIIVDNNPNLVFRPMNVLGRPIEVLVKNSSFKNHYQPYGASDISPLFDFGFGCTEMNVTFMNCEITDNSGYSSEYSPNTTVFKIYQNVNLDIINCTIGNNNSPNNGGAILLDPIGVNSTLDIYNSIIYGNTPNNIYIANAYSDEPVRVDIYHSLIDGEYNNGVENLWDWNNVIWHGGNLEEDPLWAGAEAEWPYALTAASPAIDAGTTDLPDGIELPEYDLVGNPRIYGAGIDMGAYEFQGEPQAAEDQEIIIPQQTKISNYPNPFSPGNSARGSSTTISLELVESGKTELGIYNSKGQKIKDLSTDFLSMGRYNFRWDGRDNQGKAVASGTYIIKLRQNNLETASKMLVVK